MQTNHIITRTCTITMRTDYFTGWTDRDMGDFLVRIPDYSTNRADALILPQDEAECLAGDFGDWAALKGIDLAYAAEQE